MRDMGGSHGLKIRFPRSVQATAAEAARIMPEELS